MFSVVMSSEYIMPLVIQSCYAKCGLSTLMSADTEENEWAEFQGHMYCPGNFNAFLNVNKLIPTITDQKTTSNESYFKKQKFHLTNIACRLRFLCKLHKIMQYVFKWIKIEIIKKRIIQCNIRTSTTHLTGKSSMKKKKKFIIQSVIFWSWAFQIN
jgi:hypothetical protein